MTDETTKPKTTQQADHLDNLLQLRVDLDDQIKLCAQEMELISIGQAEAENPSEACRRLALCKTKLEEARFWAGSAKQAIWDDPAYKQFADKR